MTHAPVTQTQLLAAINALHEAEAANRPLAARVSAVVAALGLGPTLGPQATAELATSLVRVVDRLQQRVESTPDDASNAEDLEAISEARMLLEGAAQSGAKAVD